MSQGSEIAFAAKLEQQTKLLNDFGVLNDKEYKRLPKPARQAYIKAMKDNPWWRLNHLYKIEDELGEIVTFKMRDAQRDFFATAWYYEIILKARQLGFSTAIDIYGLDQCLWNNNFAVGIIAQDLDSAGAIFSTKVEFPYNSLPRWLRKKVRVIKRQGGTAGGALHFSNGSRMLRVGTSFRSGTLQMLHVSELGRICAGYPQKAKEIQTGSFPTVHKGGRIFVESTAEGAAGLFFDMCKHAEEMQIAGLELGEKDFNFRFVPWFTHPKYLSPVPAGGLKLSKYFISYFASVEKATGVQLSDERKQWYVETYMKLGEHTKQEYPSTPQEAFLTSGRRVFDAVDVMRAEGRCEKPLIVYDVNPNTGKFTKSTDLVNRDGKGESMQKGLMGYLLVWELPEDGKDYACGADIAEGLEHGDKSSFDILDEDGNQVAHWYGHLDTVQFARLLGHVCTFYNKAFLAPERNNHGHAVIAELRNVYPLARIYNEEAMDRDSEHEETQRMGWLTTKKSKPVIIEHLKEAFRTDSDGIRWIGTISEANTYVYDEKGSSNAIEGAFDDQVMSYAIANEMVARMPRTIRKDHKERKPRHWMEH